MDMLSVKGSDVSLSLTGSKRTNSRPGAVTDDFRALLTGQQTNSQDTKDSKEISKDTKDIKDTDQETDQATNDTKRIRYQRNRVRQIRLKSLINRRKD